ncbi:ABC transporter substrate-binding protein [Vulgatibacter sp.]|uniref:ABC transporter substrate-binding protein n=1 Tax=Vulgatibacter sp. TaxID=1971226 RepID=UPI003568E632
MEGRAIGRSLWFFVAATVLLAGAFGCSVPAQRDADAIVVALQADGKTLDPHRAVDAGSIRLAENLYESLLSYGAAYGEVAPGLARDWSVEEGGRVVRLLLRPGARFRDGRQVTAADVAWSIERIRREKIRAAHFAKVRSIETPDEGTVILRLDEPFAPLLTYLAHPMNAVVDRRVVEANDGRIDAVDAGSGPFALVEWRRDRHLVMRRVADGQRVIFRPIADESARSIALRTGHVDLVLDVPARDVPLLEADPAIVVGSVPGTFWEYVGMNCRRPPFDDVRVRQAVALAIDRDQLIRLVKLGEAERLAGGHIPRSHWAYAPIAPHAQARPAEARALLAEAGHPQGFETTLIVGSAFPYQVRAGEVVKQQLAAAGIRVRLVALESSLFFDALGSSDFDMGLAGWVGFVDPDEWTWELFHSAGKYNQQQCGLPALDELLEQGRVTVDRAARAATYRAVQALVVEDAPMAFLHLNRQISAWRRELHGYRVHPTATTRSLRHARIER